MVTFFKEFPRNSRESFPVTDSSEILEKFPRIGPQDERFLLDHSFETQFQEISEKFSGIFPHEIPQNFSRNILWKFLRISYHVYGFLGELIKRISFKKFLGISPKFQPKKFWEILWNASPEIPEKFLKLGHHI